MGGRGAGGAPQDGQLLTEGTRQARGQGTSGRAVGRDIGRPQPSTFLRSSESGPYRPGRRGRLPYGDRSSNAAGPIRALAGTLTESRPGVRQKPGQRE